MHFKGLKENRKGEKRKKEYVQAEDMKSGNTPLFF